jgi:hypothetical protein
MQPNDLVSQENGERVRDRNLGMFKVGPSHVGHGYVACDRASEVCAYYF